MRKYLYSIIFATVIFNSCSNLPENETIEVPSLRASSLYRGDSVFIYMTKYEDKHAEVAGSYYRKAEEVKSSNAKKAIYLYKRAISLHPTIDAYRNLGLLLLENGYYEEATKALELLCTKSYVTMPSGGSFEDFIFEAPDDNLFYNYFISSYLKDNYMNDYLVYLAKDYGFNISGLKDKFLEDPRVQLDKNSQEFKDMMLTFMDEKEIKEFQHSAGFFSDFISSIKDTSKAFEIDEKNVRNFNYGGNYGSEFDERLHVSSFYVWFLKEKQDDPDGWFDFNLKNVVSINDSIRAVVYAIDTSAEACPKDMRHIYYRLVTYGKNMEILDSKIVAAQSGEVLKTLKFERDKFLVKDFKRIWRKEYNKNDFDNEIVKTEFISENHFRITQEGKIENYDGEQIAPAPQGDELISSDTAI